MRVIRSLPLRQPAVGSETGHAGSCQGVASKFVEALRTTDGSLASGGYCVEMSDENVELVRSIYEAFNRRDWDAGFRDAHPDFEFTIQRGPSTGTHRGREEVQGLLEDQAAAFDVWIVEPERFFETGDRIVAFVRFHLRPKGSTAEFEIRIGHLWTIRDGKVSSVRGFPEREKALEAAGLRE